MHAQHQNETLRRFFSGIAEQTFQVQLGVVDPPVTDYISDLLLRFVRTEELHRIRRADGRPVRDLGRMVLEADSRIGTARRKIHRQIGDYALFWAGLFPESLGAQSGESSEQPYGTFCVHGQRAYLIASEIDTDEQEAPPGDVLERIGTQFQMCAYGLREVRREWERVDDDQSRPFLIN
jgi:hypothetical protein